VDPREKVVAGIKAQFLSRFEKNFTLSDPTQTPELRLLAACAYYYYIYKIKRETFTFAWIPLKYLNEVKHRAQEEGDYVTIPKYVLEGLLHK